MSLMTPGAAVGLCRGARSTTSRGLFEETPTGDDGLPTDRPARVDATRARSRGLPVAKERRPCQTFAR
jgi:hypothetical protein